MSDQRIYSIVDLRNPKAVLLVPSFNAVSARQARMRFLLEQDIHPVERAYYQAVQLGVD